MLFIIKTANSLEFLRENLEILDGKEGMIHQTEYRQRWIDPQVAQAPPRKGQQACIVFSDPPWNLYIPIRCVTLLSDVHPEGDTYSFSYSLGARTTIPDLKLFTQQLKLASKNQYFVVQTPAASVEPSILPERVAWRRAIQSIVGFDHHNNSQKSFRLERYLSSYFIRVEELLDQNTNLIVQELSLQVGHQYALVLDVYAPHLPEEKISQLEIVGSATPPVLAVRSITASRDARLSLKISPVFSGNAKLKIWIQPEQTRSSQATLNCKVEEFVEAPTAEPVEIVRENANPVIPPDIPCINQAQIQALYRQLLSIFPNQRDISWSYRRELARELAQLPLDEDSKRYLLERQGLYACRQENFEDAYRILDEIGIERIRSQSAVAAYFISAWKIRKSPDIRNLINRFETSSDPGLTDQIRELLPWKTLIKQRELVEQLFVSEFLTVENLKEIIASESSAERIADWVRYITVDLGLLRKEESYRILRDWLEKNAERFPTGIDQVARLAFEWGFEMGEEVGSLLDWFGSKILSEKELDRATKLREDSVKLDTPLRIRFFEALTDLIKDYASPDWRSLTADLFVDIARYYLSHADRNIDILHLAGVYLEKARVACGDTKNTDLQKLQREWEELTKETDVIKDYLAQFDEAKQERLRQLLKDKKVVFVGGLTKEFDAEQIARQLGFGNGEHVELDREKGNGLSGLIKRIGKGKVDYIVDMISFAPHHDELKNACRQAKSRNRNFHYVPYTSRSRHVSAFQATFFKYHKLELMSTKSDN